MKNKSKYSTSTKYCYPQTNVLRNKFDIKNAGLLQDAEQVLSSQRLLELVAIPVLGNFDLEHLKKIHKYIFQDIYEFAGEIRTEDISKGITLFANWQHIEEYAVKLFLELEIEACLNGLSLHDFAERAAYYMAELNMLHPFREGNGRAIREFIRCLAVQCGYTLNWDTVSEKEILDASIKSVLDISALTEVILKAISEDADNN